MTVMTLVLACRSAEPAPVGTSRSDARDAALRVAFATPGVWEGPAGRFEVTPARTLRVALDDQAWELALIAPYADHFLVVQQTDPRMPLYAPAWVDARGAVHLGAFFSNRVGIGPIDDGGHAVLPWTPMHRLVVDPGPRCRWESDLAQRTVDVPCTAVDPVRLRFTVPEADREPWSGEHEALLYAELGVVVKPGEELEVFTRLP